MSRSSRGVILEGSVITCSVIIALLESVQKASSRHSSPVTWWPHVCRILELAPRWIERAERRLVGMRSLRARERWTNTDVPHADCGFWRGIRQNVAAQEWMETYGNVVRWVIVATDCCGESACGYLKVLPKAVLR